MPNDLFNLPQELWIQILSNLDAISLTHCTMTCKYMHETLRNSSQLQCTVQLYLDGLEDAGAYASHSELNLRLRRRRQAWLSLTATDSPRGVVALDMKHECQAYELVGGAFANTDGHQFEIGWLPTSGNVEEPNIQKTSTGIWVRDFAMDPTQDVIVFLDDGETPPSLTNPRTIRIHIRTISTNASHPRARENFLKITVIPDNVYGNTIHNAILQLVRNTLVLYFCTSTDLQPRIHIWDWTTSDVLVDSSISFDPLLPLRYEFGLLDSTYCFVTSTPSSGSIRLYKLIRSPSITGSAVHLATLHLPPTSLDTRIFRISTHAGPIEANPLSRTPFIINDHDRLHAFTMIYQDSRGRTASAVDMFVHQRVFIKYCMRADHGDAPLDIPWVDWGPQNARLIYPPHIQQHWLRYVHGQHVVFPIHTADDVRAQARSSHIEVLDFSLAGVLSQKNVDSVSPLPWTLVPPTVIRASEAPFFLDDVETCLPYISSKRTLEKSYSAYMVYEGGLVGVTPKDDGGLLLHVYPV